MGSQSDRTEPTRKGSGRTKAMTWGAIAAAATLAVLASIPLLPSSEAMASPIEFTDVREQTRQFMEYYRTIELDSAQEAVKREALSALPAPCCSDRSAYTCCCSCNMAKTWWGLSHYLIAEKGMGAEEVRAVVAEWFEFINPSGFSGDSCYRGGCSRPFDRNGCGGMNEEQVAY